MRRETRIKRNRSVPERDGESSRRTSPRPFAEGRVLNFIESDRGTSGVDRAEDPLGRAAGGLPGSPFPPESFFPGERGRREVVSLQECLVKIRSHEAGIILSGLLRRGERGHAAAHLHKPGMRDRHA